MLFQEICASYESLIKHDPWKDLVTFLQLLKLLKLKKEFHQCPTTFKVFNTEKSAVTFLELLKFLILKKDNITVSKFLIQKKDSITFLGRKVFTIEKGLHHFLETLKSFNFEKWLHHILITLNVFQISYSV